MSEIRIQICSATSPVICYRWQSGTEEMEKSEKKAGKEIKDARCNVLHLYRVNKINQMGSKNKSKGFLLCAPPKHLEGFPVCFILSWPKPMDASPFPTADGWSTFQQALPNAQIQAGAHYLRIPWRPKVCLLEAKLHHDIFATFQAWHSHPLQPINACSLLHLLCYFRTHSALASCSSTHHGAIAPSRDHLPHGDVTTKVRIHGFCVEVLMPSYLINNTIVWLAAAAAPPPMPLHQPCTVHQTLLLHPSGLIKQSSSQF